MKLLLKDLLLRFTLWCGYYLYTRSYLIYKTRGIRIKTLHEVLPDPYMKGRYIIRDTKIPNFWAWMKGDMEDDFYLDHRLSKERPARVLGIGKI